MTSEERGAPSPVRRRLATMGLLGVNLLVALWMALSGASPLFATPAQIIEAGGVEATRVWDGEVWRLVSASFVHVGIWHLLLNGWVLLQIGPLLERLVGPSRLLLLYLTSGAFGFAVSVAVQPRPTCGASGAIFGLVGALLALAWLMRHAALGRLLVRALVPFVVATLVIGFVVPMVDNSAHVGGLVFGGALAFGLHVGDPMIGLDGRPVSAPGRVARRVGVVVIALSALAFLAVVAYSARPTFSPRYHAIEGVQALQQKRLDDARRHAAAAARLAPDDAVTLLIAGRVHYEEGHAEQARRLLQEGMHRLDADPAYAWVAALDELGAAGRDPDEPFADERTAAALCDAAIRRLGDKPSPTLKNTCAWLALTARDPAVKDPVGALALAQQAVHESKGENAMIVHTLAEAWAQNGDPAEGLAHLERMVALGQGDALGRDFLEAERRRLGRLVAQEAPTSGKTE